MMRCYDIGRRGSNGPEVYAKRMASYVKDVAYIRAMTLREYGRAPGVERIGEMIDWHERQREKFAKRHGGRIA